jgi:hypothetical protein
LIPRQVAEEVADIARVPEDQRELFCDAVCYDVEMIWKRDRRAELLKPGDKLSGPGEALKKAAQAARTLDQAFGSLTEADRKWVEKLLNQEDSDSKERLIGRFPLGEPLRELSFTVWLLARLFSRATGEVPPLVAGLAKLPVRPGRKRGAVKDSAFASFVFYLHVSTAVAGGKLTLDKNRNFKDGTLVEALKILRPYLPRGVIPDDLTLHLATLQRIKTAQSKAHRSF